MEQTYLEILNNFADSRDISERLKGQLTESLPKEDREKLLLEIKFLEYDFREGDLRPAHEYISPDGKVTGFPEISDFTNSEWDYIRERIAGCKSLFLKARYTHLLYKKFPHNDLAKEAIGYYKELCKSYLASDYPDDESLAIFCKSLECFLHLSIVIKSDVTDAKKDILAYLRDERIPFASKDNLAEMILRFNQFKKKDLDGITGFMLSSAKAERASVSLTEIYLKTCLKLAKKEGVDDSEIYRLLGENEMTHGDARSGEEMGIVTMHAYQQAAFYFKMAKDNPKREQALLKLTQQKNKIGLKTISYELTPEQVEAINGELNKIVDYLLSENEWLPYFYLIQNQDLLKEEADMENSARKSMKGSLFELANVQVYDINGNSKTLINEEEKIAYLKNRDYSLHLQLYVYVLMDKLFYAGIRKAKISALKTMEFFGRTWFARGLLGYNAKSDDETFSWLQINGPALYDCYHKLNVPVYIKILFRIISSLSIPCL